MKPTVMFLRILAIIAAVEALIMIVLWFIDVPEPWAIVVNVGSLTVISTLLLYQWLLKPVSKERSAFKASIDSAVDMIVITDRNGLARYVNPSFTRTTGYAPEEVIGRKMSLLKSGVHDEVFYRSLWQTILEGNVWFGEIVNRRKDGTLYHEEQTITPVRGADGQISLFVAIKRDISERKRVEETLGQSEERFRQIAENIREVFWMITPDLTQTLYVSPAYETVWGRSCQSRYDMPQSWIEAIHPEDRDKVRSATLTNMVQGDYDEEYRIIRPDGSLRWIRGRAFPIHDKSGKVYRIVGIAEDITERKEAEEKIRKLNEELERRVIERTLQLEVANKELEAFSYSVSHDLRAPLRGIDGFSQALLEDYAGKLDAKGKEHLQRVRAASQRMAQLIDDMLNLSRVTRSEMCREAVDLSALARTISGQLKKTEPERPVEFIIRPGLVVDGDPRLFQVALENLLSNAWKFTSKRPSARIEFGVIQNDGIPTYFVRDNGAGFEMAYADKLFGAFQRLHTTAEFPGTGIGLATVQRIIHRHGGRIWAEGAVEQGATFYFTLSL
jgi:PAS domain S-box-containing protein